MKRKISSLLALCMTASCMAGMTVSATQVESSIATFNVTNNLKYADNTYRADWMDAVGYSTNITDQPGIDLSGDAENGASNDIYFEADVEFEGEGINEDTDIWDKVSLTLRSTVAKSYHLDKNTEQRTSTTDITECVSGKDNKFHVKAPVSIMVLDKGQTQQQHFVQDDSGKTIDQNTGEGEVDKFNFDWRNVKGVKLDISPTADYKSEEKFTASGFSISNVKFTTYYNEGKTSFVFPTKTIDGIPGETNGNTSTGNAVNSEWGTLTSALDLTNRDAKLHFKLTVVPKDEFNITGKTSFTDYVRSLNIRMGNKESDYYTSMGNLETSTQYDVKINGLSVEATLPLNTIRNNGTEKYWSAFNGVQFFAYHKDNVAGNVAFKVDYAYISFEADKDELQLATVAKENATVYYSENEDGSENTNEFASLVNLIVTPKDLPVTGLVITPADGKKVLSIQNTTVISGGEARISLIIEDVAVDGETKVSFDRADENAKTAQFTIDNNSLKVFAIQ